MIKKMRNLRTGNFAVYDADLVETGNWEIVSDSQPAAPAPIKFEIPKFDAVPEKRSKKTATDIKQDKPCLQATSSPEQESCSKTQMDLAGQTPNSLDGLTTGSESSPLSDQTPQLPEQQ